MTVPRIAVVGRQNVGKSTLVNRLFGKRETIAHDDPGVTRDRIELEATWNGRRFGLVDTAGYLHRAKGVEALAGRQSIRAMDEADVVLLVVDVASGITEEDAQLARRLRRATSPVLVVVNKTDSRYEEVDVPAFHSLGLGDPIAVSAQHGRGVGELLDRLVDLLPDAPKADAGDGEAAEGEPEEPRFALVGRPNVGKSSLFNRLVGEERAVVFEEAGTTRDSVDALVEWPGAGTIRFVDTAGMRRAIRVQGVEYYSFVRAGEAIDRADAVAVIFDATEGLTAEDEKIAFRVLEAGKALLLVANKWDLVEDKDRHFKQLTEDARMLGRATVVRSSAVRGQGVARIPELLLDLRRRWSGRASTSRVNEILQEAQGAQPPPRSSGTLHYAAQVATRPPSFVVFGGGRAPGPGYRRYIENRFREAFRLDGVPLRMSFRTRTRGRSR
ncbi:MAG: ribosome biogenesis GTPase Der [Actinobacteria bacterium]|nr:ribosome biogenesis GTPase Der [Actinomycetota bacterium]